MKVLKSGVFWGVLMVVAGGLLSLEVLGILAVGGLLWSAVFGVAGVGFLYAFLKSRENWWTAIPAAALLGLAALVAWGELAPGPAETWGGSLFLSAIGAGFWAVYLLRGRDVWWAIIPGGVLLTLAVVAGLSSSMEGMGISAVLFGGLALTFALLAVQPTDDGRMRWPLIPAGVLGTLGVLFAIGSPEALYVMNYLWAVALVAGGLYLVLRAFGYRAPGSGRRPRPHG